MKFTTYSSVRWNEVRPGVRKFALLSLGLTLAFLAAVFAAEYWGVIWRVTAGLLLIAVYYGAVVLVPLILLYLLIRFVKWSWYRN